MLSRLIIGAALAASLPLASALADPLPVGAAAKVGLAPEGLQRLTDTLKGEVDKGRMPGAVIAVARKGQLAYFEAIGYRGPRQQGRRCRAMPSSPSPP